MNDQRAALKAALVAFAGDATENDAEHVLRSIAEFYTPKSPGAHVLLVARLAEVTKLPQALIALHLYHSIALAQQPAGATIILHLAVAAMKRHGMAPALIDGLTRLLRDYPAKAGH